MTLSTPEAPSVRDSRDLTPSPDLIREIDGIRPKCVVRVSAYSKELCERPADWLCVLSCGHSHFVCDTCKPDVDGKRAVKSCHAHGITDDLTWTWVQL